MTSDHENELEALLARLDELLSRTRRRDAIYCTLQSAPRTTATSSLREHEVVRQFRQQAADGLIQLDTVHQLLGLVGKILDAAVRP